MKEINGDFILRKFRIIDLGLLLAIVCSLISCGKEPKPISITYPRENQTNWNTEISGEGCKSGDVVKIYIKTDKEYLQKVQTANDEGQWHLKKSYPTKGMTNYIYAEIYHDKKFKCKTPTVKVFLK